MFDNNEKMDKIGMVAVVFILSTIAYLILLGLYALTKWIVG